MNLISQDSTYLWPTNSGKFLSSTFGETRSAHFHAGLDIKTWGREGYKVFASKDGFLDKLLITNKGYGKAIYIKHHDGTYTVYAHLQRFNKQFQEIADSIRIKELDYSYTFEQSFEDQRIEVQKGDIIGYTGSTGIGPPHLHFEIRNNLNQPINPLLSNLTVKDTVAPVFSSILIEPLSIKSTVFGSFFPTEINPINIKNDTTYFDTVYAGGDFGLSANVYDQANLVNNKYAVYELALILEGRTLYHEKLNRFDFTNAENMFVNRVATVNSSKRSFQRLFGQQKFGHPFLVEESQFSVTKQGRYELVARDYYGNQSVAVIPVVKEIRSDLRYSRKVLNKHWTNNWIILNDTLNLDLRKPNQWIAWDSTASQKITTLEDPNYTISRLNSKKHYSLTSPDYKIKIQIDSNTFFDSLSLLQDVEFINDTLSIQIGVPELVNRKNLFVQVQLPEIMHGLDHLNLYQFRKDEEPSFVDSWVFGTTLNAEIPSLGRFIVLKDSLPPVIREPELVTLGNGMQTYTIKTDDDLSGIDFKSAKFKINGIRGIPEFDYENNSFTFYLPEFYLESENRIYLEISDKAGNFTYKSFLHHIK
ncbi:M23 family metallopeptidase [bacterium]|nr:M23 family metallopeptidase [bacterium]